MISYEVYKIIHLIGLSLLFMGLGGVLFSYLMTPNVQKKVKLLGFSAHGIGIVLILVSGFGLAARLGMIRGLPTWIYLKITIWIFFAIAISIAKRKANLAPLWIAVFATLVGVAAWLAITKPAF